jgi:outer membrane protein OmpA-like peptidoglycan-associated protein
MISHTKITLFGCAMFLSFCGLAQDYKVSLAEFNTEGSDFAPAFYGEGVVICSNRNQKIHKMDQDSMQKYRTDLFFIPLNGLKPLSNGDLFSKELTTWLNEGPCTFSPEQDYVIYTGNIAPVGLKRTEKVKEYKLGLFEATMVNGIWGNIKPLPFNTKDNKYNVAHPSLHPDGNTLVFSSNMTGTLGGADLFISKRINGEWTDPGNISKVINTAGNEFFPYFDEDGRLWFASDGHTTGTGMDIFYTVQSGDGSWRQPIRLPEPMNSPFDDFAVAFKPGGRVGFIASNRKDGGLDNIYELEVEYPSFTECREIQKPKMCYHFSDNSLAVSESTPLELEWDMGDGKKVRGSDIKYCYADTGRYQVKLNIVDVNTGAIYSRIAATEINIFKLNQPYISCRDEMETEVSSIFAVTGTNLTDFDLEDYFWEFGDGQKAKGLHTTHIYDVPGDYRVTVGAVSFPDGAGKRKRSCAYKNVKVFENGMIVMADSNASEYEEMALDRFERFIPVLHEGDSAAYYVLVKESKTRIPLNDPFFDKIQYEIRENPDSLLELFRYTVGEGSTLDRVFEIFSDLYANGYRDVEVKGELLDKFKSGTSHTGTFINEGDTLAVNREFAKFSHINFEYNSFEIMSDSYSNLDYIVSMLKVSPQYRIGVWAHTDIIGGDSFNQKLSDNRAKSVVDYLVAKGIQRNRISSKGFGLSKPIADNDTEEGRAINRRVEFELLSDDEAKK